MKDHITTIASILLALALLPCASVSAQCIAVLDVRTELPFEADTPGGKHLSYFYNLALEQYTIRLSRNSEDATAHGPFMLQRSCLPGSLRWESEEFALFESSCGTFCWSVDALAVSGATLTILRPLAYDQDRNLIAYYADKDVIAIQSLSTMREQRAPTGRICDTASGLCFGDTQFSGNALTYVWQDGERLSIALDPTLLD